jgi:hypothetical protein
VFAGSERQRGARAGVGGSEPREAGSERGTTERHSDVMNKQGQRSEMKARMKPEQGAKG